MLSVFICEDDLAQREKLEKYVKNFIMIEELEMELVLVTDNPDDVLAHLDKFPKTTGLYFLDIDLGHEMNGISLAAKVKEVDEAGRIVFVTTHGELSFMTFSYKVEALDYIIKDNLENLESRMRDCMKVAYNRYINNKNPKKKTYKIINNERVLIVDQDDIMFISSSEFPHMLMLHLDNGQIEYYGSLREAEEALPEFYRSHKSYLLNPKNVKEVIKATNEVEMTNEEIALVSVRKMKGLINIL